MMTATKANLARRRCWWIVVAIAVVGGAIATVGYAWVHTIAVTDSSSPTSPGSAIFFVGAGVLLGALIAIRVFARPDAGGHVIWASVGMGGVAISINLIGLSITDPTNVASFGLFLLGLLVGLFAAITFVVGVLISTGLFIAGASSA